MQIEFDPAKQQNTLSARGLDFARAAEVFAGNHLTRQDERQAYAETRYQTVGWLDGRLVMTVWTPRGAARRIISMRKINERETQAIGARLD